MKDIKTQKKYGGLFLLMVFFFFWRTAFLSPVYCFAMNVEYPHLGFSVEAVIFVVLLLIFSVLLTKTVFKIYEKLGQNTALICVLAFSDPLFFSTQNNCLKLLINIFILLLILNALREKQIVPVSVAIPLVLFSVVFLVPFSILGYVPLILSVYILVGRKTVKNNSYIKVSVAGAASALLGFLLNNILTKTVPVFNDLISALSFAEQFQSRKRISLILVFLPIALVGIWFISSYNNAVKKKNKDLETVMDSLYLPFIISAVSVFFVEAEGFCAMNLMVPSVIVTLMCLGDKICLNIVNDAAEFIKSHKLIAISALIVIYSITLCSVDNYNATQQLIYYIRY